MVMPISVVFGRGTCGFGTGGGGGNGTDFIDGFGLSDIFLYFFNPSFNHRMRKRYFLGTATIAHNTNPNFSKRIRLRSFASLISLA
jgi:hypothetical protein